MAKKKQKYNVRTKEKNPTTKKQSKKYIEL